MDLSVPFIFGVLVNVIIPAPKDSVQVLSRCSYTCPQGIKMPCCPLSPQTLIPVIWLCLYQEKRNGPSDHRFCELWGAEALPKLPGTLTLQDVVKTGKNSAM